MNIHNANIYSTIISYLILQSFLIIFVISKSRWFMFIRNFEYNIRLINGSLYTLFNHLYVSIMAHINFQEVYKYLIKHSCGRSKLRNTW